MSKFSVVISDKALKSLKKIDKHQGQLILSWIEKNLQGCSNPRDLGKPLKAEFQGYWRYRVGSYRIIAEIIDDKVVIAVINIAHRRDVYSK